MPGNEDRYTLGLDGPRVLLDVLKNHTSIVGFEPITSALEASALTTTLFRFQPETYVVVVRLQSLWNNKKMLEHKQ